MMERQEQNPVTLKDAPLEDIYVSDPVFEEVPFFAARQVAYRKVGRIMGELVGKAEKISFAPQEKEIFERVFAVMSVIDFMIDDMKREKSEVTDIVAHENSEIPSLNKALSKLHTLIEANGDYEGFIAAATRAISYSGKDALEDRHREALYLGKAIAVAVSKDEEKRAHLISIFGILTSMGNALDDVMDYKRDGKDIPWAYERVNLAMRQIEKLYSTSDRANTYLFTSQLTALT